MLDRRKTSDAFFPVLRPDDFPSPLLMAFCSCRPSLYIFSLSCSRPVFSVFCHACNNDHDHFLSSQLNGKQQQQQQRAMSRSERAALRLLNRRVRKTKGRAWVSRLRSQRIRLLFSITRRRGRNDVLFFHSAHTCFSFLLSFPFATQSAKLGLSRAGGRARVLSSSSRRVEEKEDDNGPDPFAGSCVALRRSAPSRRHKK